jgi:predicted nucleotidyltransferase
MTAPTKSLDHLSPDVRALLEDAKIQLTALYGERLVHLVLFGSQARGDAHEESDVDLLIVLEGEVRQGQESPKTSRIVAEYTLRYPHLLSTYAISNARYRSEQTPFLQEVRKEGILL